jgi:beta-1,4-mannosyltransferase
MTHSSGPITVYPLPPQLLNSPYLDQLYAPMAELGIAVRRGRPRHELLRLLVRGGPRVLHLHFFDELTQRPGVAQTALRSVLFLCMLLLLRRRGVRLVWTAHNVQPHETYHSFWGFVVYRMVARMSDAVIAHSHAAKAMLADRYGPLPHCVVIPHGSYVGLYGPMRDQQASRAALGLPAGGRVLLNFGTLRPYKNIEGLIDAFAQLPEQARGTLMIVGAAKSAAYADRLRQRAATVPGVCLDVQFIPDPMLPTYLAAADAVVLPYRTLLTSGVLLWALSYGRPVVAPDFGPVGELVREGQEGFLFAPGDQHSLQEALQRAITSHDLETMGAVALATAQRFAWPAIAAATAACYRQVVERCAP